MATMKALLEQLQAVIPQECPSCGRDLTTLVQFEEADKLINLIAERVQENRLLETFGPPHLEDVYPELEDWFNETG